MNKPTMLLVNRRNTAAITAGLFLLIGFGWCRQGNAQEPATTNSIKLGFMASMAEQSQHEWAKYWGVLNFLPPGRFVGGLVDYGVLSAGRQDTAEELYLSFKQFNVLVWEDIGGDAGIGGVRQFADAEERIPVVREALERYVSEGGGLFIMPQTSRYPSDQIQEIANPLFESFGMEILREGVYDGTRMYLHPANAIFAEEPFFYTENLLEHPVTLDVGRLYLSCFFHSQYQQPGVIAVDYSEDWDVVVSAHEEAKSYNTIEYNRLDLGSVGSYTSAPPIAAVRSFGAGRIFSFANRTTHLFLNYGCTVWPKITAETGDAEQGIPSDGLRLATNAWTWLAEPSLAMADFGSFTLPPDTKPILPEEREFEWNFPQPVQSDARGIIGVHTAYSDGEGDVDAYVAEAKRLGLKFLVFTESLEAMTESDFESLKADCLRVSSNDFYACPGIEFVDSLGLRWATYSERLDYPPASNYVGETWYEMFDGNVLHMPGLFSMMTHFSPLGLVGTDKLYEVGGHQANMWWFHRFFPLVYDGTELIEEDIDGYLFGLRDVRFLSPAGFSQVTRVAELEQAAASCVTVFKDIDTVKTACNTSGRHSQAQVSPVYVTQGPAVPLWQAYTAALNGRTVQATRGMQRVRAKFEVTSTNGIQEVTVHDADFGAVRRFLGHGAQTFSREFELVFDRQHYLVLEVTDTAGKKAISSCWYSRGVYRSERCGDNLNFLGSDGIILHPDRHQPLQAAHPYMGHLKLACQIRGIDGAGGAVTAPVVLTDPAIVMVSGRYPDSYDDGETVGMVLDVPMSSDNIGIYAMDMGTVAEAGGRQGRPSSSSGRILRHLRENEYIDQHESSYVIKPRIDWHLNRNLRRPYEATDDYRGGIIWHEGTIEAKQDIALHTGVAIPMQIIMGLGGVEESIAHNMLVRDRDRGKLHWTVSEEGPNPDDDDVSGTLTAGSYAALMPSPVGYRAFLAGTGINYHYDGSSWLLNKGKYGRLYIGIGNETGSTVPAGTVYRYRYAMATVPGEEISETLIEDMSASFNLDGGTNGYPFSVTKGVLEDAEMFFTVRAVGNEAAFTLGPRQMICDLPVRVRGLEDNGCVAVYTKNDYGPYFKYVPMVNGEALFQERIDEGASFWAGNIFVCESKDVKMTLVNYGRKPDQMPFLELHNPTDEQISSRIWSPSGTPFYGGFNMDVTIPASDSIRIEVNEEVQPPAYGTLITISGILR